VDGSGFGSTLGGLIFMKKKPEEKLLAQELAAKVGCSRALARRAVSAVVRSQTLAARGRREMARQLELEEQVAPRDFALAQFARMKRELLTQGEGSL
jgi:hypothetical protein